jgi:citrate/tricarballylate utilization protein
MPPHADTLELDTGNGACEGGVNLAGALNAGEAEVARIMQICNACRYCEGFCAVFPAMTRRLAFDKADTHYLANLCHNCGSCLYACQYAPPHEFAVNVPLAMAKLRVRTYQDYAWPAPLGRLYERAGLTTALALAGGLALFLVLAVAMHGPLVHEPLAGNFYRIFPHNFLAVLFSVVFLFAICALSNGYGAS